MPGFLKADFLAWKSCDTSVPPCDLQFGRKVIPRYSPKWMQVSQVFQTRRICGMGFHSSENLSRLIFIPDFGFTTWVWVNLEIASLSKSWNCFGNIQGMNWGCVSGVLHVESSSLKTKHHESLRPRLSLNMHHTPVQVTLACSSQSLINGPWYITILSLSGH